jgi:hypothetical protein
MSGQDIASYQIKVRLRNCLASKSPKSPQHRLAGPVVAAVPVRIPDKNIVRRLPAVTIAVIKIIPLDRRALSSYERLEPYILLKYIRVSRHGNTTAQVPA